MTPNLKLQEAIKAVQKFCSKAEFEVNPSLENALTIETKHIRVLLSAAQSIMAGTTEITKLREFVDYILQEGSWQGCDIDGGDAQDKAEQLGLIELRPIKEEDSIDGEKEHYFTKWTGNPKPSGEAKQMTVERLEKIINSVSHSHNDYMSGKYSNKIATALFEAVYGGRKE